MATGMATRCSACGTVFRVVPDQLRVSDGWVRCGRCSEVFNAAAALLDLETGAPRPEYEAPRPRAMAQFGAARAALPPPSAPSAPLARNAPPEPAPGVAAPEPDAVPMPVVDETASRFAVDTEVESTRAPEDTAGESRSAAPATPSFVRQADRAARWRHPRVRLALVVVGMLATLGLAAQVLHEYRDLAAARFTFARPALQQACEWLSCTVEAAHLIDSLVVESSGLVRVEKSSVYKLSVALRNRAALEVAMPALELSLTDSQGKLVARRVLRTAELGVNQATLAPGRELTMQATLQAATAPVAGYTIELFYP